MMSQYPRLDMLIHERGIKQKAIANALGIDQRTFYNKRRGTAPFKWDEAQQIHSRFFPDVEIDELFEPRKPPENRPA